MSAFVGDLMVKLVQDDESGIWELLAPFSFQSSTTGTTITAPQGFRTDFCSVPRVPLAYDMLGNRARMSGTIHDYLYTTHEFPREVADQVLREMLTVNDVGDFEAEIFYQAVRAYGGSHWGPTPTGA